MSLAIIFNGQGAQYKEMGQDFAHAFPKAQAVYEKVETYGNCTVDVDYGPCYILAKAGKLIDVDPFDYSWKTSMIVTKEKVTVRDGYGADRRILYQKTSDINPKELKK